MKIIFIGTSEFASIVLEQLIGSGYSPVLIITETDKPAGRNQVLTFPPVKITAQKYGISVDQPEKIKNYKLKNQSLGSTSKLRFFSIRRSNHLKPDLIVVASYGQIIPQEILDMPKHGCLNVHPSLLPEYRGASPIQKAILNGDKKTGVTIIQMTEKIDSGPIVAIEKLEMKSQINYQELHNELANLGGNLLVKTIPLWVNGKIMTKSQDESKATYTEIITKKYGKIDWSTSATEIERKIRAFNPWPGTYTFYEDKKTSENKMIKILDAEIQEQTSNGPFGPLGKVYIATNNKLAVQTGKDFLIIKKLQMENKKPVNVEDFINGNIDFIGTIFN